MWPVRPTFHITALSMVVAVIGGNFQAIAPRGSRPTTPRIRCSSRSFTFTTTPSISKSSPRAAPPTRGSSATTDSMSVVRLHVRAHREAVLVQPLERLVVARRTPSPRARPRCSTRSTAAARRRARGRAGGSSRRRSCAGSRTWARRPPRAASFISANARARHVHLAAHLEQRRRVLHRLRDHVDRQQVVRHVLADLAVAARGAALELAVAVEQRDREAVDLRLGDELDLLVVHVALVEQAAHARLPGAQLVLVARVREREHRLEVLHLLELLERLAAHALGRRVGRAELGVLGLERAQLVEQGVVVGVRDLGVVERRSSGGCGARAARAAPLPAPPGSALSISRAAGRIRRSRSKPPSASIPARGGQVEVERRDRDAAVARSRRSRCPPPWW